MTVVFRKCGVETTRSFDLFYQVNVDNSVKEKIRDSVIVGDWIRRWLKFVIPTVPRFNSLT